MKKNLCPEIEQLIAYRLNLLNDDETLLLDEHLKGCVRCQKMMAIENEIDKELSTSLDPGDIEGKILKNLKFYREVDSYQHSANAIAKVLRGIMIITVTFGAGIILNKIWIDSFNEFVQKMLQGGSLTVINVVSIIFFLASLIFSFRKSINRII